MGGDPALKSSGAPLSFSADLKFSGGLPASSRIDVGFAPADDVSGFHLHPSSPGGLLAVSAEEAVQEHCIHQVSSVTAAFTPAFTTAFTTLAPGDSWLSGPMWPLKSALHTYEVYLGTYGGYGLVHSLTL